MSMDAEYANKQLNLLWAYSHCIELVTESMHKNDYKQTIKNYTDAIKYVTKYNKNYEEEYYEQCSRSVNTICELHIKIANCYQINIGHLEAYKYLESIKCTEGISNKTNEISNKMNEIRTFIQNIVDPLIIRKYRNKEVDPCDNNTCENMYQYIVAVDCDKTHYNKLLDKIDWFEKKEKYILVATKLLEKYNIEDTDTDTDTYTGTSDCSEATDYELITNTLKNSVQTFEKASLYLSSDELILQGKLEIVINNYNVNLKRQVGARKREQEKINNINLQSNVYKLFKELKVELEDMELKNAEIILTSITNSAKTITNIKDVEDAGLVYTNPSIFTSYSKYLAREITFYETDKIVNIRQQTNKIKEKLTSLTRNKHGKYAKIDPRELDKILSYVNHILDINYKQVYRKQIPEKMSDSISLILLDKLKMTETGWEHTLGRIFNCEEFDMYFSYDHNKNNIQDKIIIEISKAIKNMRITSPKMPSFLNDGVHSESGSEIPTAEVVTFVT